MKTLKFWALSLVAVLGLYSCGNDKNEENKVYLVKSITITVGEDSQKYTFAYDNDKLSKITYLDYFGETNEVTFSYLSETKVNIKSEKREDEITLDASNVVSTRESSETNYSTTYSYTDGYLSSENWSGETYSHSWSNGNMTKSNYTLVTAEGEELANSSIAIGYSDVKNNTNLDLYLWLEKDGQDFCGFLAMSQFIKNVSKNIPNSVKNNDNEPVSITTTLDDKGRPSQLNYDGAIYTFEYIN